MSTVFKDHGDMRYTLISILLMLNASITSYLFSGSALRSIEPKKFSRLHKKDKHLDIVKSILGDSCIYLSVIFYLIFVNLK